MGKVLNPMPTERQLNIILESEVEFNSSSTYLPMKRITGNDPTPRQFVKDMLPQHYEVKETITGVIRCKSPDGIEGAEDWANFMNAVKQYFRDAFKEVNHATCYNHKNFAVYYSYYKLYNITDDQIIKSNGTE
jgi:hypothetical protein